MCVHPRRLCLNANISGHQKSRRKYFEILPGKNKGKELQRQKVGQVFAVRSYKLSKFHFLLVVVSYIS